MTTHAQPREEAARLERAHYQLQSSLYFTEEVVLDGAFVYLADGILEPEWNHAALLQADSESATTAVLQRIEALFDHRRLPSAVEVGPASNAPGLTEQLADRGYERRYRYAWLGPDNEASSGQSVEDVEVDLEVRSVESEDDTAEEDTAALVEVFRATYPDELDPGYERAFQRGQSGDSEVVHHLARSGSIPVAVASSIHGQSEEAKGVTGLYNLAVHPDWRRRGLGRHLTQLRVDEARHRGHQVFLQTERSAVESWQRRHGFRILFHTDGWVHA